MMMKIIMDLSPCKDVHDVLIRNTTIYRVYIFVYEGILEEYTPNLIV